MEIKLAVGDKVRTTSKINRAIKKGRINSTVIEEGIISNIQHFGRILNIKLLDGMYANSKPEYLELI